MRNLTIHFWIGFAALILSACDPSRRVTTPSTPRPNPTKPSPTQPAPTKPTPGAPANPQPGGVKPGTPPKNVETYRLAVVLPFLGPQFDGSHAPEKSRLAVQFYAGMQLALSEISESPGYPNLAVEVLDSKGSDAEFSTVLNQPQLNKAQIIIGPARNTQITTLAEKTRQARQILISPDSPASDLTDNNPFFIQTTPSLRAHCASIIQHLRAVRELAPDQIVLVCKQKEADRLPYFQDVNTAMGGVKLKEIIVPDEAASLEKINFKPYVRAGKQTVFVAPSWNQDFIVALLARLREQKGNSAIQVFGMPQWANFEQIDPELLTALDVHISSARYVDRNSTEVIDFEKKFYETYGTLPDEDAFNGYDITQWLAANLREYGLSFPEKMTNNPHLFTEGLRSAGLFFRRVNPTFNPDGSASNTWSYIENIRVEILRFGMGGFEPIKR